MTDYDEIDRQQALSIATLGEKLVEHSDQAARWWMYAVSHQTFELVVGDPDGRRNLVISLRACKQIRGPVVWANQRISVSWFSKPLERKWSYRIEDESVSFLIECGELSWVENYNLLNRRSVRFHS